MPMYNIIIFIFLTALMQPLIASAAEFEYDVTIASGSVMFVPNELYIGEPVRVYANIMNLGSKDITGVVGFYQGPSLLAPPHPFSLRSQSVTEDVWIDWTPTEGRYNIMVKVDTMPNDQNPGNNVYLTPMFTIAKRPPPPPPPPPPQIAQQTILPQTRPAAQTTSSANSQTSVAKKVAQQISEKLTPKFPLNPSVDRKKTQVAQTTRPAQKKTDVSNGQSQNIQSLQTGAVLGERVASELVPVGTVEGEVQPEEARNDRALTDGFPQRKQSDPARALLIIGILLAVASLAVGGYFLHKSRA